ncbi:beige/beach-related [Anaeramoeba flamelloides]|uniref:Beige/beach-related n=1 Tax=Anaeramoeba flamelloides TaxID=1746091 RepID=A0ABQ8ZEE5_9EUKA|nr:beige/beach-related [Anaeramoeba flamelloides]
MFKKKKEIIDLITLVEDVTQTQIFNLNYNVQQNKNSVNKQNNKNRSTEQDYDYCFKNKQQKSNLEIKNIYYNLMYLLTSESEEIQLKIINIIFKLKFNCYKEKTLVKQINYNYFFPILNGLLMNSELNLSIFGFLSKNLKQHKFSKFKNINLLFPLLDFSKLIYQDTGFAFLSDLSWMSEEKDYNYSILTNQFGWQYKFFTSFVLTKFNHNFNNLILNFLTVLNLWKAFKGKNGFVILKETLIFYQLYQNNNKLSFENNYSILLSFFFNLILFIKKYIKQYIPNLLNIKTINQIQSKINNLINKNFLNNIYEVIIIILDNLIMLIINSNRNNFKCQFNLNNFIKFKVKLIKKVFQLLNLLKFFNKKGLLFSKYLTKNLLTKFFKLFSIVYLVKNKEDLQLILSLWLLILDISKKNNNSIQNTQFIKIFLSTLYNFIFVLKKKETIVNSNRNNDNDDDDINDNNDNNNNEKDKNNINNSNKDQTNINNDKEIKQLILNFIKKIINQNIKYLMIFPNLINNGKIKKQDFNQKEIFKTFLLSKWQEFFKESYQNNINQIKNEHKISVKNKKKTLILYQKKISKQYWFESFKKYLLEKYYFRIKLNYVEQKTLLKKIIRRKQNENSNSEKIWNLVVRNLNNERATFGDSNQKVYWKLDKTEDNFRRRLKLKRHNNFKKEFFQLASINRDSGESFKKKEKNKQKALNKNESSNNIRHQSLLNQCNESNDDDDDDNSKKVEQNLSIDNHLLYDNIDDYLENYNKIQVNDTTHDKQNYTKNNEHNTKINERGGRESNKYESLNKNKLKNIIILDEINCKYVKPITKFNCKFILTNQTLKCCFLIDKQTNKKKVDKKVKLSSIIEIYKRKYKFINTALEFFLIDRKNFFLNFENQNIRDNVYQKILEQNPKNLKTKFHSYQDPIKFLKNSGITKKWVNRKISNFQYLMKLNTIAGRSYCDISQYPVFPWIIKDYQSKELDLNNPDNFRNLSKPIGIQSKNAEKDIKFNFENLKSFEMDIPPFHYGTHYSTPGAISNFLLRLEPFTTFSVQLQDETFDKPDRLFYSLGVCWNNIIQYSISANELIPEFFYLPELFLNLNELDLGVKQDGQRVNDVVLPPWAKKSPYRFVKLNREALESEYVSQHLHEWIDLIFGYKQKGKEAEKALNIFFHLTYEDNVKLDEIEDELTRKSFELQIENYGQCPKQLFTRPHPKKNPIKKDNINLFLNKLELKPKNNFSQNDVSINSNHSTNHTIQKPKPKLKPNTLVMSLVNHPLVYLHITEQDVAIRKVLRRPNIINTIHENKQLSRHKYIIKNENSDQEIILEKDPKSYLKNYKKIGIRQDLSLNLNKCYLMLPDETTLVSCGYFDSAFRFTNINNQAITQKFTFHQDIISCIAYDGNFLATGSKDSTICIWKLNFPMHNNIQKIINLNNNQIDFFNNEQKVSSKNQLMKSLFPTITLFSICYGHYTDVTCLDISESLDLVISGSNDGSLLIHTLQKGGFVRVLFPMELNQSNRSRNKSMHRKSMNLNKKAHSEEMSQNKTLKPVEQTRNEQKGGLNAQSVAKPEEYEKILKKKINVNPIFSLVKITKNGEILACFEKYLYLFSVNGEFLKKIKLPQKIYSWAFTSDENFIILAGKSGLLQLRKILDLKYIKNLSISRDNIRSILITQNDNFLFLGLDSGQLVFIKLFEFLKNSII